MRKIKEKCWLCESDEQLIKKFKFWKVIFNLNQYYLGKTFIALNSPKEDFLETSKEEREELFDIMKKLSTSLKKSFNPNLFNYAMLMNQERHLHVHVIPRYKEKRIFEGVIFRDKNWGHTPFSQNEFKISKEIFDKIRDKIKSELK